MDSQQLGAVFGVVAGLIHITAFVIYIRQVLKEESDPNAATWIIWSLVAGLNCVSYIWMNEDWFKAPVPVIGGLACIAVFVISWFKGCLEMPSRTDLMMLALGITSVVVWRAYQSAVHANLILQLALFISFYPTIRGVLKDASKEKATPWFLWSSAYIVLTVVVFLRWQGQWVDLVYPINGLIMHGLVGVLALRKPVK